MTIETGISATEESNPDKKSDQKVSIKSLFRELASLSGDKHSVDGEEEKNGKIEDAIIKLEELGDPNSDVLKQKLERGEPINIEDINRILDSYKNEETLGEQETSFIGGLNRFVQDELNILDKLEEISSDTREGLNELKEGITEKGKEQKTAEVVPDYTKKALGIELPEFLDTKGNEYMQDPEFKNLLRNHTLKEIQVLVKKINDSLVGDDGKQITEFKDWIVTDNYKQIKIILKEYGYNGDIWLSADKAALIVGTLNNYVKMQTETIPNLDEKGLVGLLLDADADGKLSSKSIRPAGTELSQFQSIYDSLDRNQDAKALIKNLGFGNIDSLKSRMKDNFFSTRELFQYTLNSLKGDKLLFSSLLDENAVHNKVNEQLIQLKTFKAKESGDTNEVEKMGVLNRITKWAIEHEIITPKNKGDKQDYNSLDQEGQGTVERLLNIVTPMSASRNTGSDGGFTLSATWKTPGFIEDALGIISPDSLTLSGAGISINKDLTPAFLRKYDVNLTLSLLNGWIPILAASKNFEGEIGAITGFLQETTTETGIDVSIFANLAPLSRSLTIGINASKVDEHTTAGIERMALGMSTVLDATGVLILNGKDKYPVGSKFDKEAYLQLKSTFDSITQGLSQDDKEIYMKDIFLEGYKREYRDMLYRNAEGFKGTSIGIGVTNTPGSSIIDGGYKQVIDAFTESTNGKVNTSILDAYGAKDKYQSQLDTKLEKLNNKTGGLAGLVLSGALNPVPYLSMGSELIRVKMVKDINGKEQQKNTTKEIDLNNIGNSGDVAIEEQVNGNTVLVLKSELANNISSVDGKVQVERKGDKVYIGGVNLSDINIYQQIDEVGNSKLTVLIGDCKQNKNGEYIPAKEVELSTGINGDLNNPKIKISNSSSTFTQENSTINIGSTVSLPKEYTIRAIAEKHFNKEIRDETRKVVTDVLVKLDKNGIDLDLAGKLSQIYTETGNININGMLDGSFTTEDLKNVRFILEECKKYGIEPSTLSKIDFKGLKNDFSLKYNVDKVYLGGSSIFKILDGNNITTDNLLTIANNPALGTLLTKDGQASYNDMIRTIPTEVLSNSAIISLAKTAGDSAELARILNTNPKVIDGFLNQIRANGGTLGDLTNLLSGINGSNKSGNLLVDRDKSSKGGYKGTSIIAGNKGGGAESSGVGTIENSNRNFIVSSDHTKITISGKTYTMDQARLISNLAAETANSMVPGLNLLESDMERFRESISRYKP